LLRADAARQHAAGTATAGVDADCAAFYAPTADQWRCMFVDYNAQFISTPLFVLQSKYDSWQVHNVSRPKRIVCAWWAGEHALQQ
jgi:hypothetical protein